MSDQPLRSSYLRATKREQLRAERKALQEEQSKDNARQAQCEGKQPFETYREASRIASYGASSMEAGRNLRAYKCPVCHKFHVGAGARHYPPDVIHHQRRLKTMDELLAEADAERKDLADGDEDNKQQVA